MVHFNVPQTKFKNIDNFGGPCITSPLKSRVAGIVSAWCLVLPVLSTCCPLGRQITTEGERHHDWGGDWCDHSSPSSLYTSEIINTAAGRRRLSLSGYQWWLLGGAAVTRTSLQHCSTAAGAGEMLKVGRTFLPLYLPQLAAHTTTPS